MIVAYELDGKPIGSDHGGPVRLYVAPMYGYKSAKWLDGIEVTAQGRSRATGRSAATTSTRGSASRTDATMSTPDVPPARDPAVRPRRARHALGRTRRCRRRASLTGAMFRSASGSRCITDRGLARNIHVIAGLAHPRRVRSSRCVGRWGAALRRDLGRFNRWSRDDMRWLRTFGGDRTVRLGKFNPGQKLNATFIGAAARRSSPRPARS